jgi:hypothetical protein
MTTLKESVGKRILKRKKKGFIRDVRVHNFDTAGSAVILFDTGEPESFPVIKDFRKFLEGHGVKCRAFGYVQEKEIPQELLFRKNYSFITRKDLTWYMKPAGEAVDAFYASDPDMLIDFTLDVPLELQFLVQLSTARFKIGCYTETENDYDLMINLTDHKDIGYLAEQFKHYISMLNPVN